MIKHARKIVGFIVTGISIMVVFTACNKQIVDFNYKFDYAEIVMPSGEVVEGKVQSWNDYEGEQIQVKINDVTYLVHSENVVMMTY